MGLVERIRTHRPTRRAVGALYALAVAVALALLIRQPDRPGKEPPPGPLRGTEAPKLADEIEFWIQGDELEFDDVRGQPILLVFWHPRDGLGAMAMARITELTAPFESRGLVVVGVTLFSESPDPLDPETLVAAAEQETQKAGIPFRVGLDCDGSAHELYGIERTGTPFCYLINTARICVWEGPPDRLQAETLARVLPKAR
jgi:hypothetical protein